MIDLSTRIGTNDTSRLSKHIMYQSLSPSRDLSLERHIGTISQSCNAELCMYEPLRTIPYLHAALMSQINSQHFNIHTTRDTSLLTSYLNPPHRNQYIHVAPSPATSTHQPLHLTTASTTRCYYY